MSHCSICSASINKPQTPAEGSTPLCLPTAWSRGLLRALPPDPWLHHNSGHSLPIIHVEGIKRGAGTGTRRGIRTVNVHFVEQHFKHVLENESRVEANYSTSKGEGFGMG